MYAQSQEYSLMHHALLSAYGSRWSERNVMFTIFIDDSGSAPEHKMAIAAGIVIPAARIARLEKEWSKFLQEENIPEFHASECLARNHKSPYANWDDERVRRVFKRVRQLGIRFSENGFCIGIEKQVYAEVVPQEMMDALGSDYYTWAVGSVLGLAYDWAERRKLPMHYVFDNAGKIVRNEIISALEFSETAYPGSFAGKYSFGKRSDVPALQAVDLFAYSCYQQFRHVRFKHPIDPIVAETNDGYEEAKKGEWRIVQSLNRQGIEDWVAQRRDDPRTKEILAFKKKLKEARMPKPKKK